MVSEHDALLKTMSETHQQRLHVLEVDQEMLKIKSNVTEKYTHDLHEHFTTAMAEFSPEHAK